MKIDKNLFKKLIYGHEAEGWILVQDEVSAPTDWGSEYTAVIYSTVTGHYYAFAYVVESKGGYNSLEDEEPDVLQLTEVRPTQLTKTIYIPVEKE